MDTKNLEKYAFFWSEVRLVVAALALFLGGIPPVWYLIKSPALFGVTNSLLKLCWLVSGVAVAYLVYGWNKNKQMLFGGKKREDMAVFFVMVVSGINLGLVSLIGRNIGMTISSNKLVFNIVGLLYLVAAGYLYKRWAAFGKKLF